MERSFGKDWQKHFQEINLSPFAAASIGQVHEAILVDGRRVALKVQYHGISNSIDSDLDNMKMMINLLGVFPRGLYLDELIRVTRHELHWETDYEREASYQARYGKAISVSPEKFYAPKVVPHLSSGQILCSEFVDGVEIDTLVGESQEVRNRVATLMLELTFRELFEWKLMQPDPNPANYLYNKAEKRLYLLDFGAGRDFENEFLDNYINIIHGAVLSDRKKIMDYSLASKFLTGEENREMSEAHHTGVMIVGEPFREPGLFDFHSAGFSERCIKLLPALSQHRLTPPPEEVYSMSKKVVGTYLMCIKLRAQVPAYDIFQQTYTNW